MFEGTHEVSVANDHVAVLGVVVQDIEQFEGSQSPREDTPHLGLEEIIRGAAVKDPWVALKSVVIRWRNLSALREEKHCLVTLVMQG